MTAFCEQFLPLLLICISVLWSGKEKRDSLPPNSLITGIIETIVFSYPIPENKEAIAWPDIKNAVLYPVPETVTKIVWLAFDVNLATFVMAYMCWIHTFTLI